MKYKWFCFYKENAMNVKDMKRTGWPRILRKEYAAKDFQCGDWQGRMSLSILRELTAPLTIHYPFGDVLIADKDYCWLQIALKDQFFWITAMYDNGGQLVEVYFDITNGNRFDEPDNPCFLDMYLDIVLAGDNLQVLDQDELEEALENGDITRGEYNHAQAVCRELYDYLAVHREAVTAWCGRAYEELKGMFA